MHVAPQLVDSRPPPSRNANPFATCWTRPGALAFRFPPGHSAEQLVARLAANGWWGEIVGPHGSGKSTLLQSLKPALAAAGRRVQAFTLRKGERRLRRSGTDWEAEAPPKNCQGRSLLIIDGFEQLGWLERLRVKRRCRRAGFGVLATSHRPMGLPPLVHLTPDRLLVEQLVADLCRDVPCPFTSADIAACHACHGSNLREVFFDLYDRFERLRPSGRTGAGCDA